MTVDTRKTPVKLKKPLFAVPVNSFASAVLCVGVLVSSGAVSLHLAEEKQDRTVTVEQILARRKDLAARLANDPNVPPQAKAIAMRQLQDTSGQRNMAPYSKTSR